MSDEHNEQMLWFTRRIVELEGRNSKLLEQFNSASRERMAERDLANALAEVLRSIAREHPELVVTEIDEGDHDDRVASHRDGRWHHPLNEWRRQRSTMSSVSGGTVGPGYGGIGWADDTLWP